IRGAGQEADAHSPELGRPGTCRQWVRLSAMILVDCIADWLRLANSTMARRTRSASCCNPTFNISSSSMSRAVSCPELSDTRSISVPRLSGVRSSCGSGTGRRSASVALLSLPFHWLSLSSLFPRLKIPMTYPPLRNERTPWRRTLAVRRLAGLGTFNVTTSRPAELRSYHLTHRWEEQREAPPLP